ncbi:MAG: hypothetical protein FWG30_11005 [Eubacteriaceae bacterium]|nr:hypothetical protein [Eubacteriaceae bacterium]
MPAIKEISERENLELVFAGKRPAWVPLFTDAFAFLGFSSLGRTQDPVTGYSKDIWGVSYTSTIDGPAPVNTQTQDFELKDITKWRDHMPDIDLKSIDWEADAKVMMSERVKEGQMLNFSAGSSWEQLHYMMGWGGALEALLNEPEATYDFLNAMIDFYIEALRYQCKYLKPDLIMIMDHVANAQGLLMSPETYRQVIKPGQKKMFDAIIELGAIPEMHVDGLVEDIMQDYIEMGIKAIQPFQVFNDIEKYKAEAGITCIGGWDAFGPGNLAESTEEDVRQSVRLALDKYAPTSRYVFWESGATPRFGNAPILLDEARTYGMAFYDNL